ncbi:hypothetical protein ACLKA7_015425 [Drosophila subpalustris]
MVNNFHDLRVPTGILDSSSSAAAAALKPGRLYKRRWSKQTRIPPGPWASVSKKFSYTEKRSAGWILQRHVASTGSNRSADWLKKVEWAKTLLPDFDMQSPRALDQAKRQRSQETPGPSAKKSRVQQGRGIAQITNERVLIGVLDQGNDAIPRNQWKGVETALATACFELLEQEPGPPLSAKTSDGSRGM